MEADRQARTVAHRDRHRPHPLEQAERMSETELIPPTPDRPIAARTQEPEGDIAGGSLGPRRD